MTVTDATALSNAALANEVRTAVAVKTLDAAKAQGQAALSLLDDAVQFQQQVQSISANAQVGRTLDVRG